MDAECTHDGSISHIRKQMEKGWQAMENNFMDREKLASLETLVS